MTQIILPDTPSSVLQLLNADKESLNKFASSIIEDVKEGRENALQIELLVRKYEYVLEQIKKEIKENVKTEAEKYGDKPFEYAGATVHLTATRTEYDFDVCGDMIWQTCKHEAEIWNRDKKEREEFLKTVKEPMKIVTDDGEVFTIMPPNKKQSLGVKITLK